MRAREVEDAGERARLWELAVAAFPPYEEYQPRYATGYRRSSSPMWPDDAASGGVTT